MNTKKVSPKVPNTRKGKSRKPAGPAEGSGNRKRFDQLLDDAIIGVKKK